jgi:hypothetical protein
MFRPATQRWTPAAARRVIVRSLGNQSQSQSQSQLSGPKSSSWNPNTTKRSHHHHHWAMAGLATGLSLATAASVTFMEGRPSSHPMESPPPPPPPPRKLDGGRKPKTNVSRPPPPITATTTTTTTTATTATHVGQAPRINQPPPRPDLPIYTMEEVAEHSEPDSLWYTFRGGVYDMTDFYQGHPGGAPVRCFQKKLFSCLFLLFVY